MHVPPHAAPGCAGCSARISRLFCNLAMGGRAVLIALIGAALSLVFPVHGRAQDVDSSSVPPSRLTLVQPLEPGQATPHLTVTLQDALGLAQKNDAQYAAALTEAKIAGQNRIQMRAAGLPSLSGVTSALLTQGNGQVPTGRFVTNDGVHVYRQWAVVHQEFSLSTLTMVGDHQGAALEAQARERAEIARRGLKVTVTNRYYGLLVSERKYATAQESLNQAARFLQMTQDQERQGLVAHADVIKAQIQFNQQQAALQDSQLQMENDRLALAVLLFPTLTENFSIVDDLDHRENLPPFSDAQSLAEHQNPELRVAMEAMRASRLGVTAARSALLPSVTTDLVYGIEANDFALRSVPKEFPEKGPLPNLGYFFTITLNLPVWDWGALRSKVRTAEYQRDQARVELTFAQRQAVSELYADYNEASTARATADTLRDTANMAAEELRLTILRYQAGQASALEVVDAQNAVSQTRNAYDAAQERFHVALAQLQTLTGTF